MFHSGSLSSDSPGCACWSLFLRHFSLSQRPRWNFGTCWSPCSWICQMVGLLKTSKYLELELWRWIFKDESWVILVLNLKHLTKNIWSIIFSDSIPVIQHLRQPGSVRIRVSAGLRYVKPENMVSVKLALYAWYSIHWIQLFKIGIPFLKLTARTWKWMVGRWNFLLGWPIFRGELLVSGRAIVAYNWNFCQFCLHFLFGSLVSIQNVSITVKCGPVAWYQSVLGFRSW